MFEKQKKIQKSSLDLIKTSLNYSLEISSVNGLSYLAFSTKRSIAERYFLHIFTKRNCFSLMQIILGNCRTINGSTGHLARLNSL